MFLHVVPEYKKSARASSFKLQPVSTGWKGSNAWNSEFDMSVHHLTRQRRMIPTPVVLGLHWSNSKGKNRVCTVFPILVCRAARSVTLRGHFSLMLSYRCYMECALLDIRHGTEYTRQEERPLNQQAKKNVWVHSVHSGQKREQQYTKCRVMMRQRLP